MKEIVNRKDGTLTIEKIKPCKAEIRRKMKYLIEKIDDLENIVQAGKEAAVELSEREKEFKGLCKLMKEEY